MIASFTDPAHFATFRCAPFPYNKYVRKEVKKVIRDAKFKAYDDLYDKLGTKDRENDVYTLAKLRVRKTRDFNHIKCIKNEDSRVLVQEEEIKERWKVILRSY